MGSWLLRFSNNAIGALLVRGIPVGSTHWLQVRGRRSGEMRGVPVNVVSLDEGEFLVSPRGLTQWVRNIDAAKCCTLDGHFRTVTEVTDIELKSRILEAYLDKWSWQVKSIMDVDNQDPLRHPMYRLNTATPPLVSGEPDLAGQT